MLSVSFVQNSATNPIATAPNAATTPAPFATAALEVCVAPAAPLLVPVASPTGVAWPAGAAVLVTVLYGLLAALTSNVCEVPKT